MRTFTFVVSNNSKVINNRPVEFVHVTITTESESPITPQDVPELVGQAPPVPLSWGVIISGEIPAWAFSALLHYYRNAAWVAICNSYRGSAVVCQKNHYTSPELGTVIELDHNDLHSPESFVVKCRPVTTK